MPWAMQLAVRYDKVHPPRRIDVIEAAGSAVVRLIADPRSAEGGPWHDSVARWQDTQIRKIVRRARGKQWEGVQELDGVLVTQAGPRGWGEAAVRAFVPAPVRPLPPQLAKTQVEGTHFPHGEEQPPPPAVADENRVLGAESQNRDALVAIEVTPLEEMSSGKLCAQVGHGAQLAWLSEEMPTELREAWAADGFRMRVEFPTLESWASNERPVSVVDAGYTELDGPAETVRASW